MFKVRVKYFSLSRGRKMLFTKSWIKNFLGLTLLVSLAFILIQCDPPNISATPDTNKTDSAKLNYATLTITNSKVQDPGDIYIYYFDKTTADILNAKSNLIGIIPDKKTLAFKIPPGTWKFGFGNATGAIYGLIDSNINAEPWLAYDIAPKEIYTLALATDGNRTVWSASYAK
jgi:hypothetical protein